MRILQTQNQARLAREERARMLEAAQRLEQALASASFARERRWDGRISETLSALQTALRETRRSADSKGSLLEDLADEFPHLVPRVDQLRSEYDALQRHMETLLSEVRNQPASTPQAVEQTREKLAGLLTGLRRTQTKETELIFEAYDLDIGVGD